MLWHAKYKEWLQSAAVPIELQEELENIESQEELEELFGGYLQFGTGGMRGLLGPGIHRMNRLTVRRITTGYAHYLKQTATGAEEKGVIIQYDNRFLSREFAEEAASVLAGNGILVYLSDQLRPTPLLSFLVRDGRAAGGIMITASHNPPMYNGYKIYNEKGNQITLEEAAAITAHLEQLPTETRLPAYDLIPLIQERRVLYYGEEKENRYVQAVQSVLRQPEMVAAKGRELRIIYTSLHGAGRVLIEKALNTAGFSNVQLIWKQTVYDGSFPTVELPNPEDANAFEQALILAKEQDADIIFATDPDADRLGVAVKKASGEYALLSGNQLGAILVAYLLQHANGRERKAIIKTIVTSDMGAAIARHNGCNVYETLTGFKYIGEKLSELEEAGEEFFLFGYEESFGFLVEPIVRDKDAIQAALLTAECALATKLEGRSLWEQLELLFQEYGYYQDSLVNLQFDSLEQKGQFLANAEAFKRNPPSRLAGRELLRLEDYDQGKGWDYYEGKAYDLTLPVSPVLKGYLEGGHWFCIRQSGTEEKGKLYFSCKGASRMEAEALLALLEKEVMEALVNGSPVLLAKSDENI